jgi:hypothetical protein
MRCDAQARSSDVGFSHRQDRAHVPKHALQRLAGTGMVEIRRADNEQSPVLMNREEIAPLAALYMDASAAANPCGSSVPMRLTSPDFSLISTASSPDTL